MECPDWSSRRPAWYPGRARWTILAIGVLGYGAVPAALLAAGVLAHSAALAALAWVTLLVTAACAPVAGPRARSRHFRRGTTPRKPGHNHGGAT